MEGKSLRLVEVGGLFFFIFLLRPGRTTWQESEGDRVKRAMSKETERPNHLGSTFFFFFCKFLDIWGARYTRRKIGVYIHGTNREGERETLKG